jgi:hypothetical protein
VPTRRRKSAKAAGRARSSFGQQHAGPEDAGDHAGNRPQDDRRAGVFQPLADPDRGQDEGDRAPEPDAAIVQIAALRVPERHGFAERQDRRPGGAGQHAQQQERPKIPRQGEQDHPGKRHGG